MNHEEAARAVAGIRRAVVKLVAVAVAVGPVADPSLRRRAKLAEVVAMALTGKQRKTTRQ
jgi:hypothetical protein